MTSVATMTKVGIADYNVVEYPNTIMTAGLGSCIGLVLYDERKKVAGLVHVMLPDSTMSRTTSFNGAKFADTGIQLLIDSLTELGARESRLKAKMAGGAQMFDVKSSNELMRIGNRNTEAVRSLLEDRKIPIISEDVGGNKGRTIEFLLDSFQLKIKTIKEGVTYI
ncbi:chemotaxis protein CheD [Halalkalibacillus halophilus]|uniref:chemotaxis protein CheD n=1 Tax=Halalkalibacillus halophilus TaxID=392827 RepID=UPI00041792BF|nr:chemotaxis protein CheD [Halalkalibacillus halophilus]